MKRFVSFAPKSQTISPLAGGLFGVSYPLFLSIVSLSVGFRRAGDLGDFAATLAASVIFLVAAPTAWVLSFSFIDVTRFTVIVFGITTSFPIWYLFGVALARSADDWLVWIRRYIAISLAWTALSLLLIAVIASFA